MGMIKEILDKKGPSVLTISPEASVLQAVNLMNEHKVGSLVVATDGRIAGMFTERDVLRRVVGEKRDPDGTRVAEVMSSEVACCTPETTIEEARGAMKNRRIRHLPVVDPNGRLLGLISIGDLNAHHLDSQEQTIYLMHDYLYGRT